MNTTTIKSTYGRLAAIAAVCVVAAMPSFGATYYKIGTDAGGDCERGDFAGC